MKALLAALSCLLLLAVACGGKDLDAPEAASGGASAHTSPSLGPDSGAPEGGPAPSSFAGLPDKLVVTTNIELQVEALRDAYVEISAFARSYGGFVAEAKLNDDGEDGSAFLRLRVPAARHDELVAQVRDFPSSELQREDSTAKEVTAEYTDLQSRLATMRKTEAQYGELLDRATTVDDILKITPKLDEVRTDIESLEGRIKLIDDQADFAAVTVRLSLPPVAAAPPPTGPASPVEVLVDASQTSLTVAQALLNVAIVIAVALVWLLPVLLVLAVVRRYLRRPVEAMKAWLS